MFEVSITGDLSPITQHLDSIAGRLADLVPLANAVGAVLVEDNREARLAGVDRFDSPLVPVRSQRGRAGDGPPLAPRGAASRVVAGFDVTIRPAGPSAVLVVGAWPSMPFIGYHVAGAGNNPVRDVAGVRDSAAARMAEMARAFAEGTLTDPGPPPPAGAVSPSPRPTRGPRPSGASRASRASRPTRASRATPAPGSATPFPPAPGFGPSAARVRLIDMDPDEVLRDFRRVVPGAASVQDIASVSGAPAGTVVDASWVDGQLNVFVRGEGIEMQRSVRSTPRGPVISNEFFKVDTTGTGLGARAFAQQVENAARLGVVRIETNAARGAFYNGYYTWARLGYDAPLPREYLGELPKSLAGARRVSDLMATPHGRDWWKENGDEMVMEFDLREGSLSRRTLDDYMARKAAKGRD